MRSTDQLHEDLQLGLLAVRAAEEPILGTFRSDHLRLSHKRDGSPVTQADQAAESIMRRVLAEGRPEIDVLGEEEGCLDRGHRYRWVLDPIDGTISFSRGIPLFGTLLALEDREAGRPILGIIHLPALDETYCGGVGIGAWCGEQRLTISDPGAAAGAPAQAADLIAAGDPLWFDQAGVGADYTRLVEQHRMFRGYTDCFGHAMVLRGALGAVVDPGLSLWDFAASRALVEAAGGCFWSRPSAQQGKTDVLLGRPSLVEQLQTLLNW